MRDGDETIRQSATSSLVASNDTQPFPAPNVETVTSSDEESQQDIVPKGLLVGNQLFLKEAQTPTTTFGFECQHVLRCTLVTARILHSAPRLIGALTPILGHVLEQIDERHSRWPWPSLQAIAVVDSCSCRNCSLCCVVGDSFPDCTRGSPGGRKRLKRFRGLTKKKRWPRPPPSQQTVSRVIFTILLAHNAIIFRRGCISTAVWLQNFCL